MTKIRIIALRSKESYFIIQIWKWITECFCIFYHELWSILSWRFHGPKVNQFINATSNSNYEVNRTCGCVVTEFEDMATTASPFCKTTV